MSTQRFTVIRRRHWRPTGSSFSKVYRADRRPNPAPNNSRKPTYDRQQYLAVSDMLAEGAGATAIATATGLTRQTVLRIRDDPAAAEKGLTIWGM